MSAVAFVEQSRAWARDLVNADVRGPGDLDNAMRRVEARWGIPFAALWSLRYRPPKDVGASVYAVCTKHTRRCAPHRNGNTRMNLSGPKRPPGLLRLLLARLLLWLARATSRAPPKIDDKETRKVRASLNIKFEKPEK